jgi:hypothetical protein
MIANAVADAIKKKDASADRNAAVDATKSSKQIKNHPVSRGGFYL